MIKTAELEIHVFIKWNKREYFFLILTNIFVSLFFGCGKYLTFQRYIQGKFFL